jgi:sugar phosphate permease
MFLPSQLQHIRSRLNQTLRPGGKVFYGWWIVAAASGVQLLGGMLWMQSYGAYVVLLQDEFGWSKALLAGAFALTRLESGILGPLQGWMVDRFGPRVILTIGTIIFGIGFMLFSRVDSILMFYLTFAMIAVGSSLGGFVTLTVAVVNWFERHRAKALALSQTGLSIGGLCIPLTVLALESLGWRATAFISGIIVLAVGLPLVQLVRQRPELYGEHPDGVPPPDRSVAGSNYKPRNDFTWRQAVHTPAFWLISFGHGLALLSVSTMLVHLIPHLTESLDYSLTAAGTMVALMTGCQFAGQFLGGYFGDLLNKRYMCMGCMLAHGSGLLLLPYADTLGLAMVCVMLHGAAWGVRGPLMAALRADYFGARSFGTITGISSMIVMFGMMGGPVISGLLADKYGDYQVAFSVIAAGALLGSICFWAAKPPASSRI